VGILAGFQIPTVWDRNTCGEVTMPVFHTSSSVVEKSRLLESCILPVKKKTPRTEFCGAASVGTDLAMVHSANLGLNYAKRSNNPHPG
jgi:hypothetical protein